MKKQIKRKPLLSIIIVSYNTREITKNCIESIYDSIVLSEIRIDDIEIILIDNNSTDGSQKMIKDLTKVYPSIYFIESKSNHGFGKANNQALTHAKSDYVLFLNSDIIVLKDAVKKLLDYYKTHDKKIHFLGAKLLNKDLSNQPSCGPFFSLMVIFGFLFLKGDHWGLTRFSPNKPTETDWVSGACFITKKIYMEKLNGFDEKIFMYMEEVELFFRAKQKKYKVWFYHDAHFIHLGSASSKKSYPITQAYQGFIYLYQKHYGRNSLLILKNMLQLKALISIAIGKITNNTYLTETYGKAYHMAQKIR